MRNNVRVAVLGAGQMGAGIIELLFRKHGLELVGVYECGAERADIDIGEATGLGKKIGVRISSDLPEMLRRTKPHVAIQATCSRVIQVVDDIGIVLRHGVNVISIAEEMAYPACQSPRIAAELHQLALSNGVCVIGTGINPGFVLDLLVITLSGVCQWVDTITARRVNDLSPYGPSVLASQGVGLAEKAFRRGVAEGVVVGHVGFPESIHMIADALGWKIDRVEQQREPIISRVGRETPFVKIEPGHAAGCMHTAVGYRKDKPIIRLIHPQQVHPWVENTATGDYIEITGQPHVRFAGSPEIPGGIGTAALAVNMIPQVLNAMPGLKSMTELPVPRAIMGDIRPFIDSDR